MRAIGVGALGAAGAAAIAAALVAGGDPARQEPAPVSPAAATAAAAPSTQADPHGSWDLEDLRDRFEQEVPADLRAELAALRDVPAGDRLAALERVRDAALAGEYGEQAQAGAQRLVTALAMLPPELSRDLEALVSSEEAQVPDAVERIRDRALAGEYGEQVRGWAEHLVAAAEEHGYDVTGDLDRYAPGD
jgi:hypothetical protein